MIVERLTPLDSMMLGVSQTWPQDIGAIAILDGATLLDPAGRLRIELIRQAVASRLHLVPRFRQVIVSPRRGLGGPFWADDPTFDLAEHVSEHQVALPGSESELLATVEQLRRRPLNPSKPLWDMRFLTGLPDQRLGLFLRIHHSIADGMAAMAAFASFLDLDPDAPATPPVSWTPHSWPSTGELLAENLNHRVHSMMRGLSVVTRPRATMRQLREAWPALRELLTERPATATSLNRMVGSSRQFRLIRADLDAVKRAGRARNATVNDVLLTITAGGVRALFESRGEPLDDTTMKAYAPVSLRLRQGGPEQGNLIAQMAVPLPLGNPNPGERIREVAVETANRKAKTRTNVGLLVHNRLLRRLTLMAALRQRVNVTTASIPGPPMPLHLAGARILEVFPLIPLMADEPVGIGALSYAGRLLIGIVADLDVCPDIDVLAAGVRDDLRALQDVDRRFPDLISTSREGATR